MSCEHTLCQECFTQLQVVEHPTKPEIDVISCPKCRQLTVHDQVETVQYNASGQWDALLEVANRWAMIDDVLDGESEDDDSGDENAEEDEGDDDVKKEDTEVSNHKDGRRCVRCL